MNGILIIDKPSGWTSQDVCAKLRGVLHEKRVGHSGTLDPLATGVLPVFVGRATRAVEFAENDRKRYTALLRLGLVTDTQDISGTVLETRPVNVTVTDLLALLPAFTGPIRQIPPMYSAVKIGGRKLYEIARRGESVERPPREVTVYSLTCAGQTEEGFLLEVECSKGTYIRTLCHDIGQRLGCGGVMASLRRTRAGAFDIAAAHPLSQVVERAQRGDMDGLLLPVDSLFSALPAVTVSEAQERKCRGGAPFPVELSDGRYRVYAPSGAFLLVGQAAAGQMRTVKSFFEVI